MLKKIRLPPHNFFGKKQTPLPATFLGRLLLRAVREQIYCDPPALGLGPLSLSPSRLGRGPPARRAGRLAEASGLASAPDRAGCSEGRPPTADRGQAGPVFQSTERS